MRLRNIALALAAVLFLGGCAETSAPLPPSQEVLLVLHRTTGTLSGFPLPSLASPTSVAVGLDNPTALAALGGYALVSSATDDAVAVIDLRAGAVARTVTLSPGSAAAGLAMVDDSLAYVANAGTNTVTRINYQTGDTASVPVGVTPLAAYFTRGRVFVLNGNLSAGVPLGPSWITVVNPVTNTISSGIDSIALPGPGFAAFADVARDGLLYVVSRGDTSSGLGRLSIVDPVDRDEQANFGGIGTAPGNVAAGPGDLVYISSPSEGVMTFDLALRQVTRGTGTGVPIPQNSFVEVDQEGRVYALEPGACTGRAAGTLHVLRADLTETKAVLTAECPVALAVTLIPPGP